MPQLDKVTFCSQVIWFTTIFLTFFEFNFLFLLPKMGFILKSRGQIFFKLFELSRNCFFEQQEQLNGSGVSFNFISNLASFNFEKIAVTKFNFLLFWCSIKNIFFLNYSQQHSFNFCLLLDDLNFNSLYLYL